MWTDLIFLKQIKESSIIHWPLPLIRQHYNTNQTLRLKFLQPRFNSRKSTNESNSSFIEPEYASWIFWNRRLASPAAAGFDDHLSGCHFWKKTKTKTNSDHESEEEVTQLGLNWNGKHIPERACGRQNGRQRRKRRFVFLARSSSSTIRRRLPYSCPSLTESYRFSFFFVFNWSVEIRI